MTGLTLDEARKLKPGDVLIDRNGKRWKVNGRVKLWKKPENAHRIYIPLKHGLYRYDNLDEHDFRDGVCNEVVKEVAF
jgi:hypothetical protein